MLPTYCTVSRFCFFALCIYSNVTYPQHQGEVVLKRVVDGVLIHFLSHYPLCSSSSRAVSQQGLQHSLKGVSCDKNKALPAEMLLLILFGRNTQRDDTDVRVRGQKVEEFSLEWFGLMCCWSCCTEPRLTTGLLPNQNEATDPNSSWRVSRNSWRLPLVTKSWRFPSLNKYTQMSQMGHSFKKLTAFIHNVNSQSYGIIVTKYVCCSGRGQ